MQQAKIIEHITSFPKQLDAFAEHLTESQLNTAIRTGAWTVRQSIHHLVDSHTHSYIRIKFALTEDNPEVKPYEEKEWAKLIDCVEMPLQVSLDAIRGIHGRLAYLLERFSVSDWSRTLVQPELGKVNLTQYCERMAVHGLTHLGSLKSVISSLSADKFDVE